MKYGEQNLKRLIEYENLSKKTFFEKVASVLGLEYFEDDETLTVASISFVLDISVDNIKLIFVDEEHYSYFTYVEFYFNFFYKNKDYLSLYNVIKFFSSLESSGNREEINLDYANPIFCRCILNYDYCISLSFADVIKKGKTYNIFTHKYEKQIIEKIFIGVPIVPNDSNEKICDVYDDVMSNNINFFYSSVEDKYNLSYLYDSRMLNIDVFKYFQEPFYYKETFSNRIVEIKPNLRIHVDGEYSMNLSFLFKRGFTLFHILKVSYPLS